MNANARYEIEKKIVERLEGGESVESVAAELGLDTVTEDDCEDDSFGGLAVLLPGWVADDGNAEVASPESVDNGADAAQEYVDGGGWDDQGETWWAHVYAWRAGFALDADGDVVEVQAYRDCHTIEVNPDEPACPGHDGHDWSDGGDEFGGARGHGGGVKITTHCTRCGLQRVENTWAQDRTNGRQGLPAS